MPITTTSTKLPGFAHKKHVIICNFSLSLGDFPLVQLLLLFVRFEVETNEEHQVERRLAKEAGQVEPVVAGLEGDKGEADDDEDGELDDLNLGDVPLPPEVRLHVGPKGGQAVVAVHDLVMSVKKNEN